MTTEARVGDFYHIAGGRHILLPNINMNDYSVVSWNWFDLSRGCWNSCAFKTKEEALDSYDGMYKITTIPVPGNGHLPEELFEI